MQNNLKNRIEKVSSDLAIEYVPGIESCWTVLSMALPNTKKEKSRQKKKNKKKDIDIQGDTNRRVWLVLGEHRTSGSMPPLVCGFIGRNRKEHKTSMFKRNKQTKRTEDLSGTDKKKRTEDINV